MKKNVRKVVAFFLITAFLLILPFSADGTGVPVFDALFDDEIKVSADSNSSYSFIIGNKEINDGQTIDYSLYNNADKTLTIILRSTDGIPDGTKITWVVSNSNIITVKSQDDATCSVTLNIISPGFSGLSVTMLTPEGVTYTAIAYCSIYVPLEWSDNVSSTDITQNNIVASDTNGNYGLFYAQTGEKQYSLQLYTPDSVDHPEASHYLRKLKYVTYKYEPSSGKTGNVTSDVKAGEIGDFTAALTWESSDPSVATVDSLTGLVTAVSAGFTTISVKTSTENEREGEGDVLSYNVVVVPEATVVGYTSESRASDLVVTSGRDREIIFQTNATHANTLGWRIFKGDYASQNNDITKELAANTEISEANGRVVLKNLTAGVYLVTAIPVKDSAASRIYRTYDVTQAFVKSLSYIIIVPLTFPQSPIVLSYYNQNIFDSYDVLANTNIPKDLFRYYTLDEHVAKAGLQTGVLEATGAGSTQLRLSLQNDSILKQIFGSYADDASKIGYDKQDRLIDVEVYDGISISNSNATMTLGSELQLSLTAPSPYSGDIIWSSSDTNICSVDENGLVTAKKAGNCKITVKIKVGGVTKRAQCAIKVVTTVDSITLKSEKEFVGIGENLTINAVTSPKSSDISLHWSCSDESVAAIAATNPLSVTITGVQAGTVVISAVNAENAIVGTKIIKVVPNIEGVTLSDSEVSLPLATKFYQLYAYVTPELPANSKLTWQSSDKKVVTVDQNGKVFLVKPGSAVITVVTENGKTAQCIFTVLQGVESIAFDDTALTLYVGDTYRMTYLIKPSTASDTTLKWSTTDQKIATVDATGYITAKNTGTCVITAQATDGSGVFSTCNITVLRKAASISIDVTELTLNVNETYLLETELKPADCTDTLIFESTNAKVAQVSKKGKITAKSKGTCIIFAKTESGLSAYCTVTVIQQVTGIALNTTEAEIYVGDTLELVATLTPKTADDTGVTWSSSNENAATVDDKGVVTGVAGGSTMIRCTSDDGDYMAYALITVIEKVTEITVEESVEISVGEKLKLNAVISNETATDKTVKWSTGKKSVCTVSKKGVITGVKAGKTKITVKAKDGSGAYAQCEVKVINGTETVDVSASYVELMTGESVKIKATTEPENTTYKPVWTSSDEKIAIVNKKGKITALKAGDCTMTATAPDNPDAFAKVFVHVYAPVAVSNISLAQEELIMVAGETTTVDYSVTPANFTETFNWSSDNPTVASVDSNGRINAKSMGSANIIIMTKSGRKASVKVFVVGLSKTKLTLHQYESLKLKLEVYGAGSNNLTVKWDTDNQGIAEMNNGKVTARACGTTTVYAIVNGRAIGCTVKVIKNT